MSAWRAGVPALRAGDSSPIIPAEDLQARALAICDALKRENPRARELARAIRAETVDLRMWAEQAIAGTIEPIETAASALSLDPALARSVLRLSLLPSLARYSEHLGAIRPAALWRRGECPNCGSPPILAESRGLEQQRHWRCGVCAADWPGDRLRCPFCDETNHRRLHYRFAEGEQERFRLALCDSCGQGLRVQSTLAPISPPGLLVAELATAHLDPLAGE
jgi:FdhE protein